MANLFLGFPVPRAKIADMIAGSAPPSLHKVQHQKAGTDEIDCTGLVGAGGITNLYDAGGIFISDYLESIDGWGKDLADGGFFSLDWMGIYTGVGGISGAYAWAYKAIRLRQTSFNWDKKVSFLLDARLQRAAANSGIQYIVSGNPFAERHVGFKIDNGVLYGSVGNGAVETLTPAIETLGAGSYELMRRLECQYEPGSCNFWVNGVPKGPITTNLPTGETDTEFLMMIVVDDNAKAIAHWIRTSWFKLWKEI
ncbi:MAG: hypothetical protein Q8M94_02065 [Ignavibacteria bacterium]|nr:hypothetical protein [Ignavibacteria bacterium]